MPPCEGALAKVAHPATRGARAKSPTADVSPSRLFAALDGLDLDVEKRRWRIEVYSVADRARRRWVQLSLRGRERRMLTLSLATTDGAWRVVNALSSWLADPGHKPEMVRTESVWS
jgi:hypothetical protein